MTNLMPGEFTLRPFPVAVVAAEDKPCPRAQHQQACEKLFPFYRHAAQDVRNWRRAAYDASQQRQQTRNPLRWFIAVTGQLEAKLEQHWAEKHRQVIASQLDNTAVNQRLGWPAATAVPVCTPHTQPLSKSKASMAFLAASSVMFAQLGPELMVFTPDQRLEAAVSFAALCGSGKGPQKREALCHAAKISVRRQRFVKTGDNTLA